MPIYEGLTTEAAIQQGLRALGVTKEQVTIEVLEEAKKGFLGIGKKNARVSLELTVSEAVEEAIEEIVEEVIEITEPVQEIEVTKAIKATPSELDDEEALKELAIYLTNISNELGTPALVKMTREEGILIGKHGKTLNALQYLAQVYIHRIAKNRLSIVVNVGNYREKRQAILQRLAERTAEKVDRTGRPVFLEPMPAFERKQIHAALSKKDYVKTHSEGEEPYRYLVVEPAKKYY